MSHLDFLLWIISTDSESIQKHKKYLGKRIKRGLFKGSNYILNTEVNGALNIL
ncbi:MAG: hypothetical protein KGD63_01015 [Candidatus Lokiarchaeota archaeon]|nr:hypothetical protein [Candidatus Lokiarchaeota archaeon]